MNKVPQSGELFVLGAGFSRAISPAMPLLTDLGRAVRSRLQLPQRLSRLPFRTNVERALTMLSDSQPWQSEEERIEDQLWLHRVVGLVAEEIVRCDNEVGYDLPDWLDDLVLWWHKRNATVITLNHDLLVEKAFEAVSPGWAQGSDDMSWTSLSFGLYPVGLTPAALRTLSGSSVGDVPSFTLVKLHGSTNWYYSGRREFGGEPLYCVPVYSDDDKSNSMEMVHLQRVQDKRRFTVPPLHRKSPFLEHEYVRFLWRVAAERLKQARRIHVMGYSLPEADELVLSLLNGFGDSRREPPELIVVNSSPHAVRHFKRKCSRSYRVTSAGDGETVIREHVNHLVSESSS